MQMGIIWNALPREKLGGLGASALHRRFHLCERGWLFERIWEAGLNKFDELEGIDWEWQSADGCQIKALLATEKIPFAPEFAGSSSTNFGKNGVENQRLRGGVSMSFAGRIGMVWSCWSHYSRNVSCPQMKMIYFA
ncbi:MAG: hypothetical protein Q4D62_15195 [Planctomycetia bacterium]|nr:hypothetical protein [Planctomycetia bacterium]